MIIYLLLFLVALYLQLFLHELSHILVAKYGEQSKILGFWPYPHWYTQESIGRVWGFWKVWERPWENYYQLGKDFYLPKFAWGRYSAEPTLWETGAPRHIAPMFMAGLVALGTGILILAGFPLFIPFHVAALLHVVDWLRDALFEKPGTDGCRWLCGDKPRRPS